MSCTHDDLALSLALSGNLSSKEQPAQYSHEIRTGKDAPAPFQYIIKAGDAVQDPQFLTMLGAQPEVQNVTNISSSWQSPRAAVCGFVSDAKAFDATTYFKQATLSLG